MTPWADRRHQARTFLSLIAEEAGEALGAEAVEGVIVLAQQAGPSIQTLAGVTQVTCKGSPVSGPVKTWGDRMSCRK